jgi:hypothetical protein
MTAPSEGRGLLEAVVASRLQVLQSKRLMLASNERRLRVHKIESFRDRVAHLHAELERAQAAYRSAVLRWGTPKRADYWPVAYARLIELADNLAAKLRVGTADLPPERRFELAVEVEVVEDLIGAWRDSLRQAMTGEETA